MAALHAAAFEGQRCWNAREIVALLDGPSVFVVQEPGGFALGRAVADEAEILTLAVAPRARRQGIGRRLLTALEAQAHQRQAEHVYLEVAADNGAAIALYQAAGYTESGRRRRYYPAATGHKIDAILMRKPLKSA